ncbi:MAG TPA: hypothetical protein VFU68_08730, partial [Terracidiphilus sp.]|nr:hypothetical protein [Terracidiphilus sp.]
HPEAIEGKAASVELEYGNGRILLFGYRPQFRGQSHATYKFLFNQLYVFDHPQLPLLTPPTPAKAESASAPAAEKGASHGK